MYRYLMVVKAAQVAGGLQNLPEDKKAMTKALVEFVSVILSQTNEVTSSVVNNDVYASITVEANVEILQTLKKLGSNMVVTKL